MSCSKKPGAESEYRMGSGKYVRSVADLGFGIYALPSAIKNLPVLRTWTPTRLASCLCRLFSIQYSIRWTGEAKDSEGLAGVWFLPQMEDFPNARCQHDCGS